MAPSCQSRRERHSIAASATVTMDTARPVIQPATLAAIRIAPRAVPTPHDACGRKKTRGKTDSKVRRSGRSDKNPLVDRGVACCWVRRVGVHVFDPTWCSCHAGGLALPSARGAADSYGWPGARVRLGRSRTRRIAAVFLIERPDASVSEQEFVRAWRRDCGGRGRGHEVLDHLDEPLGVFAVGVVPDAFEDFESAAGNRRVVAWAVPEDVVVGSPRSASAHR